MKRFSSIVASATLAASLWLSFVAPATAGRYVLNQTPETIRSYFGTPTKIQQNVIDRGPITQYTYPAKKLRKAIPTLKSDANFGVTFFQNRVLSINLNPGTIGSNESFEFGQKEASQFYNFVFGYRPSIWKRVPLPNGGGGHEGFSDEKFCLGDGVAATFISYVGGNGNISLIYDRACEPPYR